MGFGDLKSDSGLGSLNTYLQGCSYIEGYVPSQADVVVFKCLAGPPPTKFNHALRWYKHIASYTAQEQAIFPGVQKPVEQYGSSSAASNGPSATKAAAEDDDFDLFGSDDEEEEEDESAKEAAKKKAEQEKKKKKPPLIAKSNIILDVKPWDDETDMQEVEKLVRGITADGLLWGTSKLVPLAYGIKKLQISCVVEDDKVGTDFLEESITAFEDHIQSVDIAAFNKV